MPESAPAPRRPALSETRLVVVAALAAAVAVASIIAIIETDAIWLIAVTLVAIGVATVVIVVGLNGVLDSNSSGED
jgi:hypothetical protein